MLQTARLSLVLASVLIAAALAVPRAAQAVPLQSQVEGVLLSAGGAAAADGDYDVTFALYAAASGGSAVWTEGPVKVSVKAGRFWHALGSKTALDAATLAAGDRYLGIAVASDPELPRQLVRSAPYAIVAAGVACTGCVSGEHIASGSVAAAKVGFNYAGSSTKGGAALDLACTGCVSVGEIKFDGDVDLGGNSLKAGNGSFSGDVVAKSVTASTLAGDGSKITGIKMPSGDCKAGETMTGIAADGTVKCAPGAGGNKTLDGMLSTEFVEKAVISGLPMPIPDNTGADAVVNAVYGKVGFANSISIDIEIGNTDLSTVAIKLLPPDDKAKGLTVCDPCGEKDAKSYKVTLTEKSELKVGSLATYIGKTVDGTWTLKVSDTSFCIVQAPGNGTLCVPAEKTDGKVLNFAISAKVTSTVAVNTPGSFQLGNLDKPPFTCQPDKSGHAYYNSVVNKISYCDGAQWRLLAGVCGNGVVEKGEACDDGNFDEADGCTSACTVAAEKNCAAILAKNAKAPSGWYTIDIDGAGGRDPQYVVCDMTTDGGGWTRFVHHKDPEGLTGISIDDWNDGFEFAAAGGVKSWLVKTYLDPTHDTAAGSKFVNAWVLNPNATHSGRGFTFFKHSTNLSHNSHRYADASRIASTKLIAGSECTAWHGSYNNGAYLWGEHRWSDNQSVGWMWMSHCSSPSYHMLIVNHDYNYGVNGRNQTLVGTKTSPGGQHSGYDEDGGAFEFFFR